MPRFEYECSNGHKTEITVKWSAGNPPNQVSCDRNVRGTLNADGYGENPFVCDSYGKRIYSTFIIKMS